MTTPAPQPTRTHTAGSAAILLMASALLSGLLGLVRIKYVNFLFGAGPAQFRQYVAPARDGHDVARLNDSIGGRLDKLLAPSNALDEHPLFGKERFSRLRRLADNRSTFLHAKRAQIKLVPGRAGAADFLLAPVLLLIALAGCLEVDAKQRRTDQRQDNRGSDRSENVGDGVGHRHRIQ